MTFMKDDTAAVNITVIYLIHDLNSPSTRPLMKKLIMQHGEQYCKVYYYRTIIKLS